MLPEKGQEVCSKLEEWGVGMVSKKLLVTPASRQQ